MHQTSQLKEARRFVEGMSFNGGMSSAAAAAQRRPCPLPRLPVLRGACQEPDLVIMTGDWNCYSTSLPFEAVIKYGAMVSWDAHSTHPLVDTWTETNTGVEERAGSTFNLQGSKYYVPKKPLERIDYIYYWAPEEAGQAHGSRSPKAAREGGEHTRPRTPSSA